MIFKKYKGINTLFGRYRGGESIFVTILTCIIISVMGVSLARLHNVSFMSLISSETSMQAQHFAKAKMDYLMFKGYNNLVAQAKTVINGTTFKDSVTLGTITTDADGIKKRTVTVSVYNDDEVSPRATLSHVFYSNDADLYVRNGNSTVHSISMHYDSSNDKLYAKVDGAQKDLGGVPVGTIVMWYGSTVPDGWVICNGSNGTPDLRDRFIVGAGNGYGVGWIGGEAFHTLSVDEMPSHNHQMNPWFDEIGFDVTNGGGGDPIKNRIAMGDNAPYHSLIWSAITGWAGGGAAHENRPPYFALYFIMKMS